MKARIKSKREKFLELQKEEILRINKLWLFSINQCFDFEKDKLLEVYEELCKQSADAAERPELWYYVDNLLIDQFGMGDIFTKEDLIERENTLKQIHKENGKKWRCY